MLLVLLACGEPRFPCGEGTHPVDGECVPACDDDEVLVDGECVTPAPECPHSVEQFCAQFLGGACPSWDEAQGWTCDGYLFDPTGAAGEPVEVRTDDPHEGCPKSVSCGDPGGWTTLYFDNGELWVSARWPEEAECGGRWFVGETSC